MGKVYELERRIKELEQYKEMLAILKDEFEKYVKGLIDDSKIVVIKNKNEPPQLKNEANKKGN